MAEKKIVKPTPAEQTLIDTKLKKKYPHMAKTAWFLKLKKDVQLELASRRRSAAYKSAKIAEETVMKKRYLKYYEKVGPGKRTLTYAQWLKNQTK